MFIKKCPICDNDIIYKNKIALNQSIRLNCKCKECNYKSISIKISKTLKEKYDSGELKANMSGAHSLEARKKMANSQKGKVNSIESNIKRSESCIKAGCGLSNKGKPCSEENKQLFRLYMINKLKATILNFHPPYNENGCNYFNKLMLDKNCFIQHALNGGEYHIEELGYWIDGYDIENNIVYEWDENRHYTLTGELHKKDIIRQNNIINFLNCEFIRIKEKDVIWD